LQKREAEGTVRTKHQLNLDPNPEGTQKILDDRRYGGREEQGIPRVGGGAGAAANCAFSFQPSDNRPRGVFYYILVYPTARLHTPPRGGGRRKVQDHAESTVLGPPRWIPSVRNVVAEAGS